MNYKCYLIFLLFLFLQKNVCPEKINGDQNYHLYIWANYNQEKNNISEAEKIYSLLFSNKPPLDIYHGYIRLLFSLHEYNQIIRLIPKIDSYFQDNPELQLLLIQSLQQTGQTEKAYEKILQLAEKIPDNEQIAYFATQIYIQNKDIAKAKAVIENYLAQSIPSPLHFIFYFLKAQIALHSNNFKEAERALQLCLEYNPKFEKGWLLLGMLYEMKGKISDAVSTYKEYLDVVGNDPLVEQQIFALLLKQKKQKTSDYNDELDHIYTLYTEKKYQQSLALLDQYLITSPNNTSARFLKIELLLALNKNDDVIKLLKIWIMKNPHEEKWYRSLHLLFQTKNNQSQILELLQSLEKVYPTNILIFLYLSDMYARNNELDKALDYLDKSFNLAQDQTLKEKILFQKGLAYYKLGKHQEIEYLVENEQETSIDFSPLLNLLAYYYATKGKNLTKAQALISKSLQQHPNNPHFLDTQAWIWYKQNNISKARELLETLEKDNSDDFYILKHLGKIHSKLGNTEKAIVYIQRALKCYHPYHENESCRKILYANQ